MDRTSANLGVNRLTEESIPFNLGDLQRHLESSITGFSGPVELSVFKGGQSNPTYLINTPDCNYVLRKKPLGKLLPSAHAVDREHRVMSALNDAGFPVPTMFCLCQDADVIGTEFYVMEYVQGRIFWQAELPAIESALRPEYYRALTQTLAQLHAVDFRKYGLESFGKPGNYFARQIGRWSKQYVASELKPIPEMHSLIDWLPNNIPAGDETSIVHGDFRLDNVVFHPTEPTVLAILDWELSTLGHPLGDFSYYCMNWRLPTGLGASDLNQLNIPSESDIVAHYCELTGRDSVPNWDFYMIYNLFRIAAILQGVAARAAQGNASNQEAEMVGARAKPIAEYAWSLVEK